MSELLVKPTKDDEFHNITPQSAGWSYVGFSARNMAKGTSISGEGDDTELCIVLMSGTCSFSAGGVDFGQFIGRDDVFEKKPPFALYVPFKTNWSVQADSDCEIAICRAPGITGDHPARIIYPEDMSHEVRGKGTNTRHVCNILPEDAPADSLLVVEVITPPEIGHLTRLISMILITCLRNHIWKKPIITKSTRHKAMYYIVSIQMIAR